MIPENKDRLRHEIKFVTEPENYSSVSNWLYSSPFGFKTAYPPRQVNNVYFDTIDLRSYQVNLSGLSMRDKMRYRWYGCLVEPATGRLEVKCKKSSLGWKQVAALSCPVNIQDKCWNDIRRQLRSQLPVEFRIVLDFNPFPVLINSYRREYFVSGDGVVRITIDRELTAFDQRHGRTPNLTKRALLQNKLILEVKCERAYRDISSKILTGIPLRRSRHSKYVTALEAILS